MDINDDSYLDKSILLHSPTYEYEIPALLATDNNYYYYYHFKYNLTTKLYEPHTKEHDWIVMLDFNNNDLYFKIYQHACILNCVQLFNPLTILIDEFENEVLKLLNSAQKILLNFIIKNYDNICVVKIKMFIIEMWFNNIINLFNSKLINFKILNKYYKK